jgi:hypothetical protein
MNTIILKAFYHIFIVYVILNSDIDTNVIAVRHTVGINGDNVFIVLTVVFL